MTGGYLAKIYIHGKWVYYYVIDGTFYGFEDKRGKAHLAETVIEDSRIKRAQLVDPAETLKLLNEAL